MDYRVEIFDRSGRRVVSCDSIPLLEAVRTAADGHARVRGFLPEIVPGLERGGTVRVEIDGRRFCRVPLTRVEPQAGDARKLVLDRYVTFHEVTVFEGQSDPAAYNPPVAGAFRHRPVDRIVRDLVNRAPGPIHYTIHHQSHPDGARREHAKFQARRAPENELELGGIHAGQWVGFPRLDATGAFARDGATVAGLVVDGVPWPDLRLLMIDPGAHTPHADAAREALQGLIDAYGIDSVELNPHRDGSGAYDGRVDDEGRYLGFLYGGGECFNAALVELGHAAVSLLDDGKRLDPSFELKDYYSYAERCRDSVESTQAALLSWDFEGNLLEGVAALAYAADCVWSVDDDGALHFRAPQAPDRVLFHDPLELSAAFGSDLSTLVNELTLGGNPAAHGLPRTHRRDDSVLAYGLRSRRLDCFSRSRPEDADRLALGILADLAYPEPVGRITFHRGDGAARPGDILELRDGPFEALDPPPSRASEPYAGRRVARVKAVTHRFSGRAVATSLDLTSPRRAAADPLAFLVRSQRSATSLYQLRLDDPAVGLDAGYHLD